MGDGAVVTPTEGTVYAPADGEVEFIFDTKHAIGFQTDSGIPMLLHMGIDTVKLEGKGFEILVTEGQKVKKRRSDDETGFGVLNCQCSVHHFSDSRY